MPFCSECGHELVVSDKFCSDCGTAANATAAVVQTPTILLPPREPIATPQSIIFSAPPVVESGMATAFKAMLLWFILAVVFLAAASSQGSEGRTGAFVLAGVVAICYIFGKTASARKRGSIISNAWATYCAIIFLILLIVSPVIAMGTATEITSGASRSTPAPIVDGPRQIPAISADDLFGAYEENEVAADQEYKGHRMRITGRVGSINKDFMDSVYLVLPSSQNMFMGVHATLSDSASKEAATLIKNQRISLTCEITGKVITDVVAKDCILNQ